MIHVLHGSVYLHHTASTAQTIGGTDATVWEIRCAVVLLATVLQKQVLASGRSPQDLPTYFSGRKLRQLFVNVLYNLGEYFGRDSHLGYTSPLPKRFSEEGRGEKGDFTPNASRLEAVYDHCLIFNLPPEIKSFSCYQELKKGIDKAERELPVKSVNRILEVLK